MRGKSIALLLLALGCGLVASVGITQVVGRRSADKAAQVAEKQAIYVAAKEVPLGTKLTAEMIKLEDWDKDKVPAGTLVRAEDVEGRGARTHFYVGEPILEQKLFGHGLGDRSDELIPKGYRVVSVKVDPVTIHHGLILPGTRVDLQLYMQRNQGMGISETSTKTILQDIKVFAVNDVYGLDTTGQGTKSIQATTVSLLVTPEQAAKVTLASELGMIRLIMRGPEDDKVVAAASARPQDLFGGGEGAQRDREVLVPNAGREPGEMDKGFKEYLKSLQAKMAAKSEPAAPPRQAARWNMRLLRGADIRDIELHEDDSSGPAQSGAPAAPGGPAQSGQSVWKATGLGGNPAKEAQLQPDRPKADGRLVPPGKEATEPGKPGSTVEKGKEAIPAQDSPKPA
jgi:pilus assembly protein CpaB